MGETTHFFVILVILGIYQCLVRRPSHLKALANPPVRIVDTFFLVLIPKALKDFVHITDANVVRFSSNLLVVDGVVEKVRIEPSDLLP